MTRELREARARMQAIIESLCSAPPSPLIGESIDHLLRAKLSLSKEIDRGAASERKVQLEDLPALGTVQ